MNIDVNSKVIEKNQDAELRSRNLWISTACLTTQHFAISQPLPNVQKLFTTDFFPILQFFPKEHRSPKREETANRHPFPNVQLDPNVHSYPNWQLSPKLQLDSKKLEGPKLHRSPHVKFFTM